VGNLLHPETCHSVFLSTQALFTLLWFRWFQYFHYYSQCKKYYDQSKTYYYES
jgi:hypothetical protein